MKIIIAGAGEVGYHIAGHLALENKDIIVIDKNPETLKQLSDNIDVQVFEGSVTNPGLLKEAGIKDAEFVLAVTNSDEHNIITCLMAHILSPSIKKLARIRGEDFEHYHQYLKEQIPKIDTIINPDVEVVKTIENLMSVPGAVDVANFADGRVKLVGVYLDQKTNLAGVKLKELSDTVEGNLPLIAAIVREETLIIPTGDDILKIGDTLYFISEENKLSEKLSIFNKKVESIKNVLIIGGGRIGARLALKLEKDSIHTKIIEKNKKRSTILAEKLDKTIVLLGDGSDQRLLAEENIDEMDVVITLTGEEETNILTSLLAKRMGARKIITRISKFSYFPLMAGIGLEQVVSPRLSAINSILHHVRRGRVLSAISLKGERAEVMEVIAMETSDIVGKPIKDIPLPARVLIIAIIREDRVEIPSGASVIMPDDRLIIFTERQDISKLEKILAVKVEYF